MNMDSLLDALTNVVGILLLVLILTSLNMTEVVRKIISELPVVTEEQFKDKQKELEKSQIVLQERQKVWNEMDIKTDRLDTELASLKLEIENLKENNKDIIDLQKRLQALLEQKRLLKEDNSTKTDRNNDASEERDRLLAILDETPEVEAPPAQMVRLPESGKAERSEEPRYVLLKYNKAYFVGDVYQHLFTARDVIDQNFEQLVYNGSGMGSYTHSLKGTKTNDQGRPDDLRGRDDQPFRKYRYDGQKVVSFFEQKDFGGSNLKYKAVYNKGSDTIELRVVPREEGGITMDQMAQANNPLEKAFKSAKFNRVFLVYYVSPDSFPAYTAARTLSDNIGLKAGWHFWKAEEFPLKPAVQRETTEYDFGQYIPNEKLVAHAAKLKPTVEKNLETAETQAATISDPALKEHTDRWARNFRSYEVDATTRAPEVADKMRGKEEILILPEPPNIPHIYAYRNDGPMPDKVPEPPKPRPDPPKDDGPGTIEKEMRLD